jgi:FixJ family two-component response regulator
MTLESTVFVVDDDPGVLKSLCWLIGSAKLRAEPYESAEQFLAAFDPARPGCLVLDVRMPRMTGLQLQAQLISRGSRLPIIVMTGFGDVPTCTRAFKGGAFDFIEKPADDQFLLDRINAALLLGSQGSERSPSTAEVASRLERLSPRQREVLDLLVAGTPLKLVATRLGVSPQTAAKHRAQVHAKMQVQSDAELVHLVLALPGARHLERP